MIHNILIVIGFIYLLLAISCCGFEAHFGSLSWLMLLVNLFCIFTSHKYVFQNPQNNNRILKNIDILMEILWIFFYLILMILYVVNRIVYIQALQLSVVIVLNLVVSAILASINKESYGIGVCKFPFKDYKTFKNHIIKTISKYGYELCYKEKNLTVYVKKNGKIFVNIYEESATLDTYIGAFNKVSDVVNFNIFNLYDVTILINTSNTKDISKILHHIGRFWKIRLVVPIVITFNDGKLYVPQRKGEYIFSAEDAIEIIYNE